HHADQGHTEQQPAPQARLKFSLAGKDGGALHCHRYFPLCLVGGDGEGGRRRHRMAQHLAQDLVLGADGGQLSTPDHRHGIAPRPCSATVSAAASTLGRCAITMTMPLRAFTPSMALISAASPSESRLELGSSSTTRNGLPYSARASAMRWRWPADSTEPAVPMR